ncbi:MAG: ABC-F family ATP-binding cassette domain-containing protein [Verrucomicrobia bacterium]|nr:ABC-F family ATP-binding cassette domain-containing protein [Verrucomicrobiota bacterium]
MQVDNLSLSYSGDPVLEDVSFTVSEDERCGLIGRNGSGKTTLMRLLVGQEKPDKGTISFSKGYKLGYLDQHIRFTCNTVLEEGCLGLRPEERDETYRAEKILSGLGFKEEEMDISPHQMSGGYQLRLHLAKVLLSEPDCLLLDEPTNYLDILSIRFLARFLQQWKGALILISHDREFMDSVTTHTLGVHRKKVRKYKGGTTVFFEQVVLGEEIHERTRINLEKKKAHLQSFVDRFGAKASKAAQAQSKQKMLSRIPALEQLKALYDLDFSFHERPFHGKKMVETKEISFAYQSDKPIIHDLSFAIEKGDRVAIIGKNGYGKSTLLRLISGELSPEKGEVRISDQATIGYFGQTNIQRLKPDSTIEEEIADANPTLNLTQVKAICGQMMFPGDTAKKKIAVLSGGEKSRVLLGKILARPCNLLLLDEPTHHLDVESIEALIDALEDFEGAVVIVTHSELILKRLQLHQLIVCHVGRQSPFNGHYEDFLEKVGWEEESAPSKKKSSLSEKEERKKRHEELMASRARIRPMENELRKLEKAISDLEALQMRENALLIQASQNNEADKIQDLLKSTGQREKEIQQHYEKFMKLGEELEALKKESGI